MEIISENHIKNLLKRRSPNSHKGTYGKVLVIAGSEGMAGAAVLAASATLRAGSGLVRVSIDRELFPIIQSGITEATCVDRELTSEFLSEHDSIIMGPGLGKTNGAVNTVVKVIEDFEGSIVLDADALNIISGIEVDLKKSKSEIIITPHPGEAARLVGTTSKKINSDREAAVSYLSEMTGAIAVLKGYESLISLPRDHEDDEFKVYMNPTGNPGMATGGSGDVLSGIIGSFLGQGLKPIDAALAGVYVHGLAGDLAAKDIGEYGIIASDIAKYTAIAISYIQS